MCAVFLLQYIPYSDENDIEEHLLFSIFGCKFLHLLNGLYSKKEKISKEYNQFKIAVVDKLMLE